MDKAFKNFFYKRKVFWIGKRVVPLPRLTNIVDVYHDVYTDDYPTFLGKLLFLKYKKSLFSKKREFIIPDDEDWIDLVNNKKIKNKKLKSFLYNTSQILWKI